MLREVGLFIFAICAVPVATFIWDIIWGLLSRQKGAVMGGIRKSWGRAIIAIVIMGSALVWLHYDDADTAKEIEQRNIELIEIINQTNNRLDKIIIILEANNATRNTTTTK